ncbi:MULTISPECIES: acyl-CoA reductase [Cecembia]|jgi:hypothetical protein|uniref:Acyl-CoA reductase LuxC n=1 Tax=Cecembia calidifontis TaxID=1187080 RepID=A0A4Q7PEI5_9BACT|nr:MULTISPECIES: acyl-CoA reductase [Cecembia]RZS98527.1 acyl-CoA reductase LuxC [Cecembia calidifontis]
MTLEDRIKAFVLLGKAISEISQEEFDELSWKIENNNIWFTPDQTRLAFLAISEMLEENKLRNWVKAYHLEDKVEPKDIGILMAGNIPAVGFHDLLCVLIAGHHASVKLSSSDTVSIKWLMNKLFSIDSRFASMVKFEEMLKGKDAYIATGSDNSARYFNYYFGKYPHIIRKNRTSIAILDGKESPEDYKELAKDVFQYFGMGCRNVSKIYINKESSLIGFLENINGFQFLVSHHKYLNNYDYNKSIYLVNKDPHLDNGFLLLKESTDLVSPIGVLYYEYYSNLEELNSKINSIKEKIQCIVSKDAWFESSLPFGQAQCPALEDYADGLDTIKFLKNLK